MQRRIASVAVILGGVAATYLASPYVALYRLDSALRSGNVDAVQDLVDWDSVRAAMKHDALAGMQAKPTAEVLSAGGLPEFGSSFRESLLGRAVDESVTPEALCGAVQQAEASMEAGRSATRLDWAHFDGPATFSVQISLKGTEEGRLMRLRFGLEGRSWRVIQVSLPENIPGTPPSHT